MPVTRAVAMLGVGDAVERQAQDVLERLDMLVDDGEPVLTAYRPVQDGSWLLDVLFTEGTPAAHERWLQEAAKLVPALATATRDALADRDWLAESHKALRPVRAGRFLAHGSHDRHNVSPSRWNLEIDAGRAFGTAHHASTMGCLIALERLAKIGPLGTMADVGTGSGILALAADRLGARVVAASDIDPVAVRVARENLKANKMRSDVRPAVASGPVQRADTVVANILRRPLMTMAPQLARSARRSLILSGLRLRDGRAARNAYRPFGFVIASSVVLDDWITLTLIRPVKGTDSPSGRAPRARHGRSRASRGWRHRG